MAREITIMTPEQVEVTFELAGLGSRFIAILLDTVIQVAVFLMLWFAIALLGLAGALAHLPEQLMPWYIALAILLVFVFTYGYFLFFEATRNGQTPGKMATSIRVIRDTGHPVDFRGALLRNLVRIVDFLPTSYGIGMVSIFLSPDYRRLGDYVAGTLVVKTGRKKTAPIPAPQQVIPEQAPDPSITVDTVEPAHYLPVESLPYLSLITREDYRALRHFLDRRSQLDAAVAHSLSLKMAEPIAKKLHTDLEAIESPLAFLENVSREWERRMIH